MKKLFLVLVVISFSSSAQMRYDLPTSSTLDWRGEDVLRNGHEGTITFQSGYLSVVDKKITKGDFIIDMNTLFSLDPKTGKDIEGLTDHLKSDDFFSVGKFPKSFFTIFSVTPLTAVNQFEVKGFLTIKGIINQVNFPAQIITSQNKIQVKAEFTIDRTMWAVTYQSKNFLENLKDIAISDDIKIKLDLNFTRRE